MIISHDWEYPCFGKEVLFCKNFGRQNFRDKWSASTSKYQESDGIWLVGVYWLVESYFHTEFATKSKKWTDKIPKSFVNSVNENVNKPLKWHLFFFSADLVNTNTIIPLRISEKQWIYTWQFCMLVSIHCFSPPIRWTVVYYTADSVELAVFGLDWSSLQVIRHPQMNFLLRLC